MGTMKKYPSQSEDILKSIIILKFLLVIDKNLIFLVAYPSLRNIYTLIFT